MFPSSPIERVYPDTVMDIIHKLEKEEIHTKITDQHIFHMIMYIQNRHKHSNTVMITPTLTLQFTNTNLTMYTWDTDVIVNDREVYKTFSDEYMSQFFEGYIYYNEQKLVIIPVIIEYEEVRHHMVCFIEPRRKMMELFDPLGVEAHQVNFSEYEIENVLQTVLIQLYDTFEEFEMRTVENTCPVFGFQAFEGEMPYESYEPVGYCVAWCAFMIDLKIHYYPEESLDIQNFVIEVLKNRNRDTLDIAFRTFVVEYSKYMFSRYGK